MPSPTVSPFLSGVIEGFYGQPWSEEERVELLDRLAAWGLNTYLYAPKDDVKHRALWREPYSSAEAEVLMRLVQGCHRRGLRFIYALSPGLDLRYGNEADRERLVERFVQLMALGCRDFALLFDDIPGDLTAADVARWGSLAAAQAQVTNAVFEWLRRRQQDGHLLFCPTAYCTRMVGDALGGPGYLPDIGRLLHEAIDILWTGPEIVSAEISVEHVKGVRSTLRRAPLIWDNLHANDYDGRRFFCGPYSGRPPALRGDVRGLLSNPNSEWPLNFVAIRTLAAFVAGGDVWDPRAAYLDAMREWLPAFDTVAGPIALDELVSFGDCYYLPSAEGPEAAALCDRVAHVLTHGAAEWGEAGTALSSQAVRLIDICTRLTGLRSRPLFHAMSRRLWELREELEVLERYLASGGDRTILRRGASRGGTVARLQLLRWNNRRRGVE